MLKKIAFWVGLGLASAACAQTAEQAVLEKVGAALVEVHAALLVDEGLQQFEFRFGDGGRRCAG